MPVLFFAIIFRIDFLGLPLFTVSKERGNLTWLVKFV